MRDSCFGVIRRFSRSIAGCGISFALLLAVRGAVAAESVQLEAIAIEPLSSRPNLLSNASFEEVTAGGLPAGWHWSPRNTDATCVVDRAGAHRGRQSLRLTNGTPFGPHVYGMLWRTQPVRLEAGKTYTMSIWARSEEPGAVSLIGGAKWQHRARLDVADGKWQRVWKSFVAEAEDRNFTLRISTESPTPGVWIDDVKLEEGTGPTADPAPSGNQEGAILEADESELTIQGDGPFETAFTLINPRAATGNWSAALSTGGHVDAPANVAAGLWRVLVRGRAEAAGDALRTMTLRLKEGDREVAASATIRFYSTGNALDRLAALKTAVASLKADLATIESRGEDASYPRVTATVLENFIPFVEEDANRGEVHRALQQVGDLEQMAVRLRDDLRKALAGEKHFPPVPRWTGEKRPVVRGSSFLAPTRWPDGTTVDRPVFFTGYGHFGRVVADMEKWPAYGTNIIQIEFGPSRVFPEENRTNDAPMRQMREVLDRAQKSGVAVCLLISPHYFPGWAMQKWPHLRKHRDGFLQYCLHAPEGRNLLRRYVKVAIAPLADRPALHSICLSNEPVNREEPCEAGETLWQAWLKTRHGSIETLNSRWGSHHAAFEEVPLPDPYSPRPASAVWIDYVRFNQEFFADWHAMLADAVHEVAPELPVHAKAMTWTMINDGDVDYGVDATLFGQFSQINGNDAVNFYGSRDAEFAQGWVQNALGHDLQRSVLDAPVFNSENHLIVDRETRYVPAAHVRAALWQAALHGQSATTIWVWERTFDPKSDFAGSIMHRPACAEAVGVVNYDLNRAALEMTALQQARPQVLLLQSVSASVWEGQRHTESLYKLYTALSFTGLKIGFVTERQLEAGTVPDAPLLIVPRVAHLSEKAADGLRKFQGRLMAVGGDEALSRDDYGRVREPALPLEKVAFGDGSTSARDLHGQLLEKLREWNLCSAADVRDAEGNPAWGVAWRSAEIDNGQVVNLCNYNKQAASVRLFRGERPASARDVLTGDRVDGPIELAPLEVRLLRLEP